MNEIIFSNSWIVTCVCVFFMGLIGYFGFHKPFYKKLNDNPMQEFNEPQAIASLGVLGTFLGISLGLFLFDATKIEESVPVLLDGMRTAFFTSIIGMVWSMLLKKKLDEKVDEYNRDKELVDKDATIGDLIHYLKSDFVRQNFNQTILSYIQERKNEQKVMSEAIQAVCIHNENQEKFNETLLRYTQEINKSLVGENDSSVINQIKLMKVDINDLMNARNKQAANEHKELIEEFREFSKTMAENNAKAFIEMLNATIHDFNEKIQEQFGENFKQLNIAVGKLLEWQEHYKNIVIETTENQKRIFAGIEEAKTSMAEMSENGNSIKESAKELCSILVTLDKCQKEITQSLKDLQEIGENAKRLVPEINELTIATNSNIAQICDVANTEVRNQMSGMVTSVTSSFKDAGEAVKLEISEVGNIVTNICDNTNKEVKKQIDSVGNDVKKICQDTTANINSTHKAANECIIDQANAISALAKESCNSIKTTSAEVLLSIKKNSDGIEKQSLNAVNYVSEQMDTMGKSLNDTVNEMLKLISRQQKEMDDAFNSAVQSVKDSSDKLENSALEVTQRVSDQLVKVSEENNKELKKQHSNMMKNLEEISGKSLTALGVELAKISQKFARDYIPLANRLKEIVEIAEKSQRNTKFR